MTPRLRQALEAWERKLPIAKAEHEHGLLQAYLAEPDDEPRFEVGDRVTVDNSTGTIEDVLYYFRPDNTNRSPGWWADKDLEPIPDEPELKPCPWCGSPAELRKNDAYFWVWCGHPDTQNGYGCEVSPSGPCCTTEAEAVAVWNRRALEDE